MNRTAVVVGAGGPLGAKLCEKLRARDYRVVAVGRDESKLRAELGATADLVLTANVTDRLQLDEVFRRVNQALPPPEVLVYNVGRLLLAPFLDTPPEEFEASFRANALGAALCARAVLPNMVSQKRGVLIFSGATASVRGGPKSHAFAAGKHALRSIAQSLAREFSPQGIHVAHVVIDGKIWSDRTQQRFSDATKENCIDPDALAATYLTLIDQPPSAWTFELDLRPFNERF